MAASVWGRMAPVARGATAGRVVVVGAGLAGLTCAYRLKQAGIPRDGLRGVDAPRRTLLDRPRRLLGRPDRRARRRADRPGPHAHSPARTGARPQARQPPPRRGEWHGAVLLLRRARRTHTPKRQKTSTASTRSSTETFRKRATRRCSTCPRPAGTSSTTCRSSTGSRRASPVASPRNWASCSRSRMSSSTELSANVQSSLNLFYLLGYSGQGQFRVFGKSNEKYHVRGGNDQIAQHARCGARQARSRSRHGARRHQARADGRQLLADVP